MNKKAIACVGQGFVGGSLTTGMSHAFDVYVYDKMGKRALGGLDAQWSNGKLATSTREFVEIVEQRHAKTFTGIYFVCVPTPMYEDGECDTRIVESVLKELSEVSGNRVAVVKSTVPPGSTERWNKMFEGTGLRVVHNPEFLTEKNALEDFKNQDRIILGGPRPYINQVKQVYQTAFPKVPIIKTSSTTSEMVKYFTNIQLAVRVILSCELWQLVNALDAKGLNIDYDKVKEYAMLDKRLGGTHMNVPGDDGVGGARGHCFPKDLNALIALAKQLNVKPTVMEAAWKKNVEIVPEEHRDWEQMKNRAISKRDE